MTTPWIVGHLQGEPYATIAEPSGTVVATIEPPFDVEDLLNEVRDRTDGRVDVRWIDADGYESLIST